MSQKNNESTYGRLADELQNYTKNSKGRLKTTEKKSNPKRSLIPKLESSTAPKFPPDSEASPEVKNTVKDIIKLLKGLDNIGGGPQLSAFDEDDPNKTITQEEKDEEKRVPPPSSGGQNFQVNPRPVRVSNIALKHDDPKFVRVTFEPFECYSRTNSSSSKNLKGNHKEEASLQIANSSNQQKVIKLNKEFPSKPSIAAHSSKKNFKDLVKISPLKAIHDFRTDPSPSRNFRGRAENNNNSFPSNEDIELINNYKSNVESDETANNNDEERFYSFMHNNVYKEPSLSIFLPTESIHDARREGKLCSHRSQCNNYETSLPTNFGAPYFRLDGSIMEDIKFNRVSQNNANISKAVKSAVQEQHNLYKEATDAVKHLKKKLIKTDSTQQQSISRSKPNRHIF